MTEAYSSLRKYHFEKMEIGQVVKYDYDAHRRVRNAVCRENKRGLGSFICRAIVLRTGNKKIAVERVG